MEAEHIYIICRTYEEGKKAAREHKYSNVNPYNRNTVPWVSWMYGWEYGISEYIKKHNYTH